jgi:hypothetical protein
MNTNGNGALPPDWKPTDGKTRRRLIMSVEGLFGSGKTDFALTAPGAIAFFQFDLNAADTIARYAQKKSIYVRSYDIPDPASKDVQEEAKKIRLSFKRDYQDAIASYPKIRSIVWDTATELWELLRLAEFGKLTQIPPVFYTNINNEMRRIIRTATESDTNLIMVHRLKDEWIGQKGNRENTGRKVRAGYGEVDSDCAVMIQTIFKERQFSLEVLKCTQNPAITGTPYTEEAGMRTNSFPHLAKDVYPDSRLEEWE